MPEHILENISAPPAVQAVEVVPEAAETVVLEWVEAQTFESRMTVVAKAVPAAVVAVDVAVAAMAAAGVALLYRGRRAVRDRCLVRYCLIFYP